MKLLKERKKQWKQALTEQFQEAISKLTGNDKVLARVYLRRAYKPTYAKKLRSLLEKNS